MKIQYILHADFERPGIIEKWAEQKQYLQSYCCPYKGELCPSTDDYDLLIIMGGPQSPLSLEQSPYLKDEIALIRRVLGKEIPVLGFCLGAQLIAEAFGAKTEKSPEKEIGVFPIYFTEEGKQDVLLKNGFPSLSVMHWHNDMPGLTKDAKILAYSQGCPRQAIRYRCLVYGFQCHPEPLKENMEAMILNCPEDFASKGKFVQSAEEMLTYDLAPMNTFLTQFLDKLIVSSKDNLIKNSKCTQ